MKYFKYLMIGLLSLAMILIIWYAQRSYSFKAPVVSFGKLEENENPFKPELQEKKKTKSEIKDIEQSVEKPVQPKAKLKPVPKKVVKKPKTKLILSTVTKAEDEYYKAITTNNYQCTASKRIGRADDGGWDICFDGKLAPTKGSCLSYSFGVNYIWEFDDIMAKEYKCVVRTFDPSMTREKDEVTRPSGVHFYKVGLGNQDTKWSNGWKIMKMSSILTKYKEDELIIDILKVDIEFSEWDSFESMLADGIFGRVRQLMFETHTEEVQGRTTNLASYLRFLKVWQALYDLGFRQWKNHWNHFGNYNSRNSGKARTCCYEHYLVNTKLM